MKERHDGGERDDAVRQEISPLGTRCRDGFRFRHEGDEASPSAAVVRGVAAYLGVDPTDLDQTLYEVIDGDLLDELFAERSQGDSRRSFQLAFEFCGLDVAIDSDGSVVLYDPAPSAESEEASTTAN